MSTSFTIAAGVMPEVRAGLFCLMGDATEAISQTLTRRDCEHHPDWYAGDRDKLEGVFAVLDLIGWDAGEPRDVTVELLEHGQTLKAAADSYLPCLADQEREADVNDKWRAEEGEPPRKQEIVDRLLAFREFAAVVEERLSKAKSTTRRDA
jgi:hypothetical protein